MGIDTSPLTSVNYTDINRALGQLNDLEIALDKAEQAGFPVDEQRAALKYYRELFNSVKKTYFAHKH